MADVMQQPTSSVEATAPAELLDIEQPIILTAPRKFNRTAKLNVVRRVTWTPNIILPDFS
jgi:hypothetical protein